MRWPVFFLALLWVATAVKYEPTWESIDSRPLPAWYDDSKFGIFCHWGVYSVPAHRSEWIWWYWKGARDADVTAYLDKHFHGQTYADFAREFTAEDLEPDQFAGIVKASGARYFVLTSKHHEGFTMWPSNTSWNWNALDVGPKRDLVGDLKRAFGKTDVHFGLYFSQFDWFHPLYLSDAEHNKTAFVEQVSYPQMIEIVQAYQPEVIWSDGDWDRPDTYWRSREFLAWLYNESPVKDKVVVNDRWGHEIMGKHGGFLTYSDHYDPGHLLERKWENCMTLDKKSWGYRRDMTSEDVHTVKELIEQLIRTISCGGNLLLNVGPNHLGRIVPIFEDRLRQLGKFVNAHEEAIFGTKPWVHQNDSDTIWYTSRVRSEASLPSKRVYNPQNTDNTIIYAWLLEPPTDSQVTLPSVRFTDMMRISILGSDLKPARRKGTKGTLVDFSRISWTKLPSTEAIVLKIEYAGNSHHNPLLHRRHRTKHANRWIERHN